MKTRRTKATSQIKTASRTNPTERTQFGRILAADFKRLGRGGKISSSEIRIMVDRRLSELSDAQIKRMLKGAKK